MTEQGHPTDESSTSPPASAPVRLDLRNFVPYRLSVLAALSGRALSVVYRGEHGLTEPEWKVMSTLAHYGPLASGDVGHYITLDRVAVSRALKSLIERGLASREIHRRDERMFLVDLTPEGSRHYDQMARDVTRIEAEILQDLEPREVQELIRLLDKVEGHFRKHTNVRRPSLIVAADAVAREVLRRGRSNRAAAGKARKEIRSKAPAKEKE